MSSIIGDIPASAPLVNVGEGDTPYVEGFRPSAADLSGGRPIDLTRTSGSPAATALADAVATLIAPHLDRKRKLGRRGMDTLQADVATMLGGLLRAGLKGRVVSAQRRPGGSQWHHSPSLGQQAFWARADAMRRVGLLAMRPGIKTGQRPSAEALFGPPGLTVDAFQGEAARFWAPGRLLTLAAQHGVVAETVGKDWPISRPSETKRPVIAPADLVVCAALDSGRVPAVLTSDQLAWAERERGHVAAINAAAARADIRGCLAPAFRRVFRHDLRLGGRLYAVGANNVQTMGADERVGITIDGEPVVELDVHASQLTVFLALTGTRELPDGDLYAVGGLPRSAVKAWVVQTFASGRPVVRWSDRTPRGVRAVDVRNAIVGAYPAFLRQPFHAIVPGDILAGLPEEKWGWAVGQYLTFRESEAVTSAASHVLWRTNAPVLPVHDSLIVPQAAKRHAVEGLTRAFSALLKITPRVK